MGNSGSLIRLIDVVFILLFGFISISEINERSRIKLPESVETPPSNPDKEHVLFVAIDSAGLYLVENETQIISDAPTLYNYLKTKTQESLSHNEELRVRIRSNFNTPIKYTMAAADICDNLNIPKGIDVRRVGNGGLE
ncbi:MAG TPA: biopolymer transporter ExbD [bacterium]